MVIGYSFQDEHINQVICTASKDCGLGTFIVDPRGRSVLADPKMRGAQIPGLPRHVEEIRIVGELRRSLREIFGGDRFATGEIDKFLSG
jgi:NADPH-dependent 2,4-dienoyl-CoA reductase/sulfur reductase-like enzyme